MPVAKWVKLIEKYKFGEAALKRALKMFVIYVASLKTLVSIMRMYPIKKAFFGVFE